MILYCIVNKQFSDISYPYMVIVTISVNELKEGGICFCYSKEGITTTASVAFSKCLKPHMNQDSLLMTD